MLSDCFSSCVWVMPYFCQVKVEVQVLSVSMDTEVESFLVTPGQTGSCLHHLGLEGNRCLIIASCVATTDVVGWPSYGWSSGENPHSPLTTTSFGEKFRLLVWFPAHLLWQFFRQCGELEHLIAAWPGLDVLAYLLAFPDIGVEIGPQVLLWYLAQVG